MIGKFSGIIWDWNGTLLDDAELAVETMNGMLAKRSLPLMTMERYKDVFTFPVKDYYQKIGFDFEVEPFEIPALEFIERYNQLVGDCSLHSDSVMVLGKFRSDGIRQFILSAMKQETLDQCLDQYQISHFFDHVSGLDDHYAHSKLENGLALIKELGLNPEELLLIGDTIHDYEVATEMGCRCILIANGHQSHELLNSTGVLVLSELKQLLD
jgi:phosphoglycolate phosphatase